MLAAPIAIWRTQVRLSALRDRVAAIYTLGGLREAVLADSSTLASSREAHKRRSRPGSFGRMDYRAHSRLSCDQRISGLHIRAINGARAKRCDAHTDCRAVRAHCRLSHRRNLRLHGWINWSLEQPNLGRWHSVDRHMLIGTHSCCGADSRDAAGARRFRTLRDGDHLRLRDDLER